MREIVERFSKSRPGWEWMRFVALHRSLVLIPSFVVDPRARQSSTFHARRKGTFWREGREPEGRSSSLPPHFPTTKPVQSSL